jgi:sulfatase maturation enzyme AslB (radical SAM superfamily)
MLLNTMAYPDKGFHITIDAGGRWTIVGGLPEDDVDLSLHSIEPYDLPEPELEHTSIVVFLTEQCNMRCSYCKYYDLVTAEEKTRTDASAIIETISDLAGKKNSIGITFFGGEPLLKHKEMANICNALQKFTNISYNVTTNGSVLNEAIIQTLLNYDITVGVSYDGEKQLHNHNRLFIRTNDTHTVIANNYTELKRRRVNCGPIAVLTNPELYYDVFKYFLDTHDDRTIHLKPLNVTGSEDSTWLNNYFDAFLEQQLRVLDYSIDHYQKHGVKLKELKTHLMLETILMSSIPRGRTCTKNPRCGLGNELQSIRPDGELIGCHDLNKFNGYDDNLIDKISSRNGFCQNCKLGPVCTSFCASELGEDHINNMQPGDRPEYMHTLCRYNQSFIENIFQRIRSDKDAVLRYYLA